MNSWFKRRRSLVWLCYIILISLAQAGAFLLRFDFSVPQDEILHLYHGLLIALLMKSAVFYFARLDRGWWVIASIPDLLRTLAANVGGTAAFAVILVLIDGRSFPRSIFVLDFLLCFLLTAGVRFAARIYHEMSVRDSAGANRKQVLIYGAASGGAALVRDIRLNPKLGYEVVGFVDDDPLKRKATVMGVPVLCRGRELPQLIERSRKRGRPIDEVIIAMQTASSREVREAAANCRAAGVSCKTIPGVDELLSRSIVSSGVRDLSSDDLLGRDPVALEESRVQAHLYGRVIMVTGAAGSIGSEICRQICSFAPLKIVMFDQAESGLFNISMELRDKYPNVPVIIEVGTIRDADRVDSVIRQHRVESIFHAAAYKHVPMMEVHVREAVKNNILGTRNLVRAACRNHVSSFLMISTDKAVNPTSVMGATKRVAEILVSAFDGHGVTKFVSVRFGNVLRSNGSVVPIFEAQIAAGGPVTVTHPDVKRYFMTIREAVLLVLQASTMGKGSEIFILDMGQPVRIVDLARNLIRLHGLEPDEDIEVRFTGLRPGERLNEQLDREGEDLLPTHHPKIRILKTVRERYGLVESWLAELERLAEDADEQSIVEHLCTLIPEYRPGASWQREQTMTVARSAGI